VGVGDTRGGYDAGAGKRLSEDIVSECRVGKRRLTEVSSVGKGAGSGSRPVRLENEKMGPDVVPEDPMRLEKENLGRKFMNQDYWSDSKVQE